MCHSALRIPHSAFSEQVLIEQERAIENVKSNKFDVFFSICYGTIRLLLCQI